MVTDGMSGHAAIFNYGIMYTRFLIKTTQPAMFAATKLRRGMIPKDKEAGGGT